jgi:hypothetical protein
MSLARYRTAAEAAIDHVVRSVRYRGLNTVGGWVRHPAEVERKVVARVGSKILGALRDERHAGPFDGKRYVDELERLALQTQTGNCSELSAVAFNYLKAQGVRPIDYFGVWRNGWNHAFVVLNRDPATSLVDFSAWSVNAVVCDPLYDRHADAAHVARWYPQALPLMPGDIMYRLG